MKINWGFGHKASYAAELVSLLRGRVREGARDMSHVLWRTWTPLLSSLYRGLVLLNTYVYKTCVYDIKDRDLRHALQSIHAYSSACIDKSLYKTDTSTHINLHRYMHDWHQNI